MVLVYCFVWLSLLQANRHQMAPDRTGLGVLPIGFWWYCQLLTKLSRSLARLTHATRRGNPRIPRTLGLGTPPPKPSQRMWFGALREKNKAV